MALQEKTPTQFVAVCRGLGERAMFPPDSIGFDHALLMRDISHERRSEPAMTAGPPTALKVAAGNSTRC